MKITVDTSSFNVDKIANDIEARSKKLVDDIAETGREIADFNFQLALYAGRKDVNVTVESERSGANYSKSIVAAGTTVLFIEYGTGILYPDRHPLADEYGMKHGTYGKGQGANPKGWYYIGEEGEMGEPATNESAAKRGLIHTSGNTTNMCMYDTAKALKERMNEFVQRSFDK